MARVYSKAYRSDEPAMTSLARVYAGEGLLIPCCIVAAAEVGLAGWQQWQAGKRTCMSRGAGLLLVAAAHVLRRMCCLHTQAALRPCR